MKIFDNITDIVRDDLKETIQRGCKVSIAAACFSMYTYKELKNQRERIKEFRFIFTSPAFVQERAAKQRREFYIPEPSRETSLYGTEFEIRLRNEMTVDSSVEQTAYMPLNGFTTVDIGCERGNNSYNMVNRPFRSVFRNNSFADSPARINAGEIFKLLAPDTRVTV